MYARTHTHTQRDSEKERDSLDTFHWCACFAEQFERDLKRQKLTGDEKIYSEVGVSLLDWIAPAVPLIMVGMHFPFTTKRDPTSAINKYHATNILLLLLIILSMMIFTSAPTPTLSLPSLNICARTHTRICRLTDSHTHALPTFIPLVCICLHIQAAAAAEEAYNEFLEGKYCGVVVCGRRAGGGGGAIGRPIALSCQ